MGILNSRATMSSMGLRDDATAPVARTASAAVRVVGCILRRDLLFQNSSPVVVSVVATEVEVQGWKCGPARK